ncbi:MAG: ferritin family protein [Thermoplasmata archaeon]|nr:MAG: ferritin family protein [Thermoplasmata archaeon]
MQEEIKILQKAIGMEEFGYYYYNKLERAVENNQGKALLSYLANAEKEHRETLEKILVEAGGVPEKTPWDNLVSNIIMNPGIERVFKELTEKEKLSQVDAVEAVKLGIDVEKKSIEFYSQNAKSVVKENMAKLFSELVDIEQKHLEILEENLRNLSNEGVWYGYVPILEG